jgi:NADPH:quinone reductase-like Zn-dependent oxidoreductase
VKRIVVDRYGGPEVLKVVEDAEPRPGQGEVQVRVLAAGVSFTDSQLRAGTYLGVPKPPFTPGYELVGEVEEVGRGCSRLQVGDRIGALTVWGAYAERVCLREADVVQVPDDLDPAEVLSLLFIYMTAYQVLHRMADVQSGEAVLVHGAAGRVGTAELELGALAGARLYGTASGDDRAAVERLGAVAIDYQHDDFVARLRELPEKGVDVVLDSLGGPLSLRSFRVLRPGGRLVVFGAYSTLVDGHKSSRKWLEWYGCTGAVWLWSVLSPGRSACAYRIQKLYEGPQLIPYGFGRQAPAIGGAPRYRDWYREDFEVLVELLRADKIHPVVAERLPLTEARRAHELLESSASIGKLVLVP